MPWLVGIDEAGYGPHLGPFVMSAALFRVPEGNGHNLWKPLRPAVRKARHKADGRVLVDDSKQVYSPKLGAGVLEKNLSPFLQLLAPRLPFSLSELDEMVMLQGRREMAHEPYPLWDHSFRCPPENGGSDPRPSPTDTGGGEGGCPARSTLLRAVMERAGVELKCLKSRVVSPRRFNQVVRESDSKGTIPLQSVGALVTSLSPYLREDEPVEIVVDRLGGRWHYAERMAEWFPGCPIRCVQETATVSRYRICERIDISFVVDGDQNSLPVALASMLSKYLREIFMAQFNAWFRQHQPGIAPTAGYPTDSYRFWEDAVPTRTRLGLRDEDWWRQR